MLKRQEFRIHVAERQPFLAGQNGRGGPIDLECCEEAVAGVIPIRDPGVAKLLAQCFQYRVLSGEHHRQNFALKPGENFILRPSAFILPFSYPPASRLAPRY